MDLVDRYLLNVRAFLPRGRADDDVAELRENIRAQVEDREERLGRPLTEEERIALLRAHGHPILVAGRYRSDGRRLVLGREVIGPALFPFFRISLLAVAAVTTLVLAIGAGAAMLGTGPSFPFFRTAVFYLSLQVGISIAVFAGLEAWFRNTAQTWDARKLPGSEKRPPTRAARRVEAAFQVLFTAFALWIWVGIPDPFRLLGDGFSALRPGPAWRLLHLGVTASTALSLVAPALTLVEPGWRRYRWIVSLFSSGAFIAFAAASLWTGGWVVPGSISPAAGAVHLAQRLNTWIAVGLGLAVVVTALATVIEVVRGAWRELRRAGPA
jgi:hypothetical protein